MPMQQALYPQSHASSLCEPFSIFFCVKRAVGGDSLVCTLCLFVEDHLSLLASSHIFD